MIHIKDDDFEVATATAVDEAKEAIQNWARPKAGNVRNWFWFIGSVSALGKRTKLIWMKRQLLQQQVLKDMKNKKIRDNIEM